MLTFPTQAEQCEMAFRNAVKTTSVATIARKMGVVEVNKNYPFTDYLFVDDTTLRVSGQGRAHKMEALLP